LDTIPDREFMGIFARVTAWIDMEGATTREEINRRFEASLKGTDYLERRGYLSMKAAANRRIKMKSLLSAKNPDFATRTIMEARRHPDGFVNLTLHYGRDKAFTMRIDRMKRLRRLEKARRAVRMERTRKAKFDRD